MIEEIQKNIDTEIEILREIANYSRMIDYAEPSEARLIGITIESLKSSMKLINDAIPQLLSSFQPFPELPTIKTAQSKKANGFCIHDADGHDFVGNFHAPGAGKNPPGIVGV